eukprot:Seg4180.1 transcript_id=Seg4180.1/GoldUCD/mRNA.D3Y31 product="Histamine H2 receptor" protein_id=Seg4180.1/GoldUCD/D3Y31
MAFCSPYPHFDTVKGMYVVIPITLLSAIIALIGNASVLFVILRNEALRTQSAYRFIASLSTADILVSSVAQPFYVAILVLGSHYSCWLERIGHFCGALTSASSTLAILIVSVDRYIFITKPLHYHMIMSSGRVYAGLAYIWVSAVLVSFLPYITGIKIFHIIVLSAAILNYCITSYCYFIIYRVVARRVDDDLISRQNKSRRQNQATRTVAFVLVTMAVCWLPYIIGSLIWALDVNHWTPNSNMMSVYFWLLALGHWNSSINVLIYSWKNTELRTALKKFIGYKSRLTEDLSSNNHPMPSKDIVHRKHDAKDDQLTVETVA